MQPLAVEVRFAAADLSGLSSVSEELQWRLRVTALAQALAALLRCATHSRALP